MLQVWGINVTALVASLGIGGLAFALAAKDTAANLFGSFSLLADKSIRIGEWIKVSGVEGTVETIGMRTTKIRSFQKSLITVPNHIVANNPIENFSRRGIRRIKMHIGLTYSTNSTQIIKIMADIKKMLKGHEGISQSDSLMVNFDTFGDSSLNIFIYTFTKTANWAKYLEIREDVNLKIMKIVEDNGSSFAFPSQSIYVESLPSEEKH
jgi:MscS family membrane protein